ncbi:hypothetical protein [Mesorhizobium sp. CN2-181]|uniref:hypothetical protein n=1 Tax=Mesorhizobium yinganensis TaxID=3157707 RepID=UPI0032B87418
MTREIPKIRKRPDPDLWLEVELTRWEWEYYLSVPLFEGTEPASEDDGLSLFGTTLLKPATAPLDITVRCLTVPPPKLQLEHVGELWRIKGGFEGVIVVPNTVMHTVVSMFSGDHYRQLDLALSRVGRRQYFISSYHFRHGRPRPVAMKDGN